VNLAAELASRSLALVLGVTLFVSVTMSLMRTVIVPRPLLSLFSDAVRIIVLGIVRSIARTRRTFADRDAVLAWIGPLLILGLLLAWLAGYLVAYGFILYGVGEKGLGDAMRESGSSLFTLGFAGSNTENQTVIDFIAAATGPIVIAMLIGFLPTIYQAYIDREIEVTMLASEAGEPAWGPELLSRSTLTGALGELDQLFNRWTIWAASTRLTHTTYPMLLHVRSQRAGRHFTVALLAVMDAAALYVCLTSTPSRRDSYRLLLEGTQSFNLLYIHFFAKLPRRSRIPFVGRFLGGRAPALGRPFTLPAWKEEIIAVHEAAAQDSASGMPRSGVVALSAGEDQPIQITRLDFDRAVEVLQRSGFPIERDLDDAWTMFREARSRYEFPAYAIMRQLDAAPAPWTGDRRVKTPTIWPSLAVDHLPTGQGPLNG
jgi:hypothetical protein